MSLCFVFEHGLQASGKELQDINLSLTASERSAGERLGIEIAHANEFKEIRDEMIAPCDRSLLESTTNTNINSLLDEQKAILKAILDSISEGSGRCIFVDAPGGTGKTFTFNAILGAVRLLNEIALAVASSGIAAILLDFGRTFHARFKASREPAEGQMLGISGQSALAELLRRAKLIIWDEAAMGNKFSLEALDASLKDFMQNDEPFGGKIVVLGGDYRQTLPIIKGASRAQTLRVTLSNSYLWKEFDHFKLSKNMRVERVRETLLQTPDDNTQSMLQELSKFADWLLKLGENRLQTDEDGTIELDENTCLEEGCDIDALVEWVYPKINSRVISTEWLASRAILAPYHVDVNEINDHLTKSFPGEEWICESADAVGKDSDDHTRVGIEVLNTFNGPGLPLHQIKLKPNMPIMLMRNLNPRLGMCNGTRLIVIRVINGRLIEATIATGSHRGQGVLIPRIMLSADPGEYPFEWTRRQFPIRVAFAMTINKAQGQTLECVGVYLKNDCFSHGQLYVAASRVGHPQHIRFAVDREEDGSFRTRNVVYNEVLT